MTRILCIGEAMAEIRGDGTGFAVGFAGDAFNTAVYCRRCLRGGDVAFQTRIGNEPLSQGFLRLARAEGLDLSAIRHEADHNLGIYSVQTDEMGERTFAYWRNQSAARRMFRSTEDFAVLDRAELIYLSGITLAILSPDAREALLARLAALREAGVRLAFDSNYRPRLWPDAAQAREAITRAWALADIALPSVDDEMALFGDADEQSVLSRLRQFGVQQGALKRGAKGPLAIGERVDTPYFPPADQIVDTTAAGDSFNGAFLAATAEGRDTIGAMTAGHALARIVVTLPGAIIPHGAH